MKTFLSILIVLLFLFAGGCLLASLVLIRLLFADGFGFDLGLYISYTWWAFAAIGLAWWLIRVRRDMDKPLPNVRPRPPNDEDS